MLTAVVSSSSPLPSLCQESSQRFCQCRKYSWKLHFETAFSMFNNCFWLPENYAFAATISFSDIR